MNTTKKVANQIVELVRPSVISQNLGIPPVELAPILAQAVMLGYIRKSDILFTFPQSLRDALKRSNPGKNLATFKHLLPILKEMDGIEDDTDECEARYLWAFTKQRVVYSDLYEMLSTIEITLHERIRHCLGKGFWRRDDALGSKGVPLSVRKSCVARQEEDDNPSSEPYSYTTLIDLKDIIEANWDIFSKRLPISATKDRKKLSSNFNKLNSIRNKVMHPVRLDESPGESEYRFVLQMHNTLVLSQWR
jgi:hypothetical protein